MADEDDKISGIGSPTAGSFSGSPKEKEDSESQNGQSSSGHKNNGGLFSNRYSKMDSKKQKVKKQVSKDPYYKNFLPKTVIKQTAGRELAGSPLRQAKRNYDHQALRQKKIAKQIQRSENPQEIDTLEKQFEQGEKNQKKNAFQLMSQTMAANIKRIGEYGTGCVPGCLKDLKGCLFSTVKVLCLTILGGASIVGIILKLCGVF